MTKSKIAVIGGGVAGASVALYLGKIGVDVSIFEKSESLVNGPPICHLHAGGNLYREISDTQCVALLKESIELVRFYPDVIDYRPTIIATPIDDAYEVESMFKRLELLKREYQQLVNEDIFNEVLGASENYYRLFSRHEIELLKEEKLVTHPKSAEEWMIPFAKNVDLDSVKYPLIMVQEYGINIFRLAATLSLRLEGTDSVTILLHSEVTNIVKDGDRWILEYQNREGQKADASFDYIINAAGFKSGSIDDMCGFKRDRFVEFKAAYVSRCEDCNIAWPEIIFHGQRGTPRGMAQFTPYPDGYFQLHGMTKEITLFDDGLVKNPPSSAQPPLSKKFLTKIEKEWGSSDSKERTELAINHLSQFIPLFSDAKVASKPLYGAQQIPGDDDTLRAAEVSFEGDNYARCEIVKASSVITMADAIVEKLIDLGYIEGGKYKKQKVLESASINEKKIEKYAEALCREREYPLSLSHRNFEKKLR